ncbi:MAG: hypothetical protein NVS9B2_31030 [Steroidobacteraceae bacterium]
MKPEEVVEMETRLAGQEIAFEADDEEDGYSPAQYLADGDAEPFRLLEAKQSAQARAEGLDQALAEMLHGSFDETASNASTLGALDAA